MKNSKIKNNENKSQKIKVSEIVKFLKITVPLVEQSYKYLADKYPCDSEEDNFDFLHELGENFITVPKWVQEETECGDKQFRFVVDSKSNCQ